jgi:hypothetical protein
MNKNGQDANPARFVLRGCLWFDFRGFFDFAEKNASE